MSRLDPGPQSQSHQLDFPIRMAVTVAEMMLAMEFVHEVRRESNVQLEALSTITKIGAKMLWNILGPSVKRVALTLEEPADTPTVELIRRTKDKLKRRLPPIEVSADQAPIYQNTVTGKNIDLSLLPIPRHWPLDGGRYAGTGDAVITRDRSE